MAELFIWVAVDSVIKMTKKDLFIEICWTGFIYLSTGPNFLSFNVSIFLFLCSHWWMLSEQACLPVWSQHGDLKASAMQRRWRLEYTGLTLLNQTFQRNKSESFNDLSSAVILKEKLIQIKWLCIFILVK